MKYLLLAYGDEQQLEAMSTNERDAFERACIANDEALRESGHLLVTEELHSGSAAAIVRVRNGQLSVTDGPFVETKEQLIKLFIINARDLNEAIRVASQMPQARRGSIEVRPLMEQP